VETPIAIETPADPVATPSAEESTISGQVLSISGRSPEPLKATEARLAAVFWDDTKTEAAFLIDAATSPTTLTDEAGSFKFIRIEPRDYVIVVGDLYGQNVILSNPDGSAVVYTAQPGEVLDVGILEVDLEAALVIVPTPVEIYPPPIITPTPNPAIYP
jgi:hypothetical protein